MAVVFLRCLPSMMPNGTKTVTSSVVVLVWLGLNQGQERKKDIKLSQETNSPVKKRLRTCFTPAPIGQGSTCFFCDAGICDEEVVHRAVTKNLDSNVRFMATELRDTKLLARLSVGDMTASDAVYHKNCITALQT